MESRSGVARRCPLGSGSRRRGASATLSKAPRSAPARRISPKPRSKFATPPNRAQDTGSWARSFSASRCIKIEISASTQAALSFRSVVPAILHVGLPYGGGPGAWRGGRGTIYCFAVHTAKQHLTTRHGASWQHSVPGGAARCACASPHACQPCTHGHSFHPFPRLLGPLRCSLALN